MTRFYDSFKCIFDKVPGLIFGLLLVAGQLSLVQAFDPKIAVWIRLGDLEAGLQSLEKNKDCINRVLVSDHAIEKNGIHCGFRVADGSNLAKQAVNWSREHHLPVMMGLGNYQSGFGHPRIIAVMLKSKTKQAKHIKEIIKTVKQYDYDGVDLDYENLPPSVRNELTTFVHDLARALHSMNKKLDITVPPKFSSPGWRQTKAYDWNKLPAIVDRFNVMCYDWFVRSGPPGPIIPLGVTKKVIAFAQTCPHSERFWIGHPAYGNHWIKKKNKWRGKYAGAREWQALAEIKKINIKYKTQAVGGFETGPFAHFQYHDKAGSHQVWYGDHKSLETTMTTVAASTLGGIFIWRAGFEDEKLWSIIRQHQEQSAVVSSQIDDAWHPAF